eukprot:GFYU01010424.1.p1 GENE.GFYU01010424.1~~GFYU01010424.1.p1  ORF type:complete len:362 (-),score=93.24 GFYU01010424.1:44-1012(-)
MRQYYVSVGSAWLVKRRMWQMMKQAEKEMTDAAGKVASAAWKKGDHLVSVASIIAVSGLAIAHIAAHGLVAYGEEVAHGAEHGAEHAGDEMEHVTEATTTHAAEEGPMSAEAATRAESLMTSTAAEEASVDIALGEELANVAEFVSANALHEGVELGVEEEHFVRHHHSHLGQEDIHDRDARHAASALKYLSILWHGVGPFDGGRVMMKKRGQKPQKLSDLLVEGKRDSIDMDKYQPTPESARKPLRCCVKYRTAWQRRLPSWLTPTAHTNEDRCFKSRDIDDCDGPLFDGYVERPFECCVGGHILGEKYDCLRQRFSSCQP